MTFLSDVIIVEELEQSRDLLTILLPCGEGEIVQI